ncbi:hypothetical protein [Paenibacillus sp. GP183]|uniref:hypothetical protein n=1 Tax=Paenibacillus sp. GP183 TaxID=1882751 RepID=UPI00089A0AC2|nr:hypothetical protein [Paenibacillus sp. GP183]SEB52758.1 hypothetical protein SAMN05443246_0892 [Paenibacillus sp. GP183]
MKKSTISLAAKAIVVLLIVVQSLMFLPAHTGITNKAYAEGKRIVATWLWNTYSIWKEKDKTLDFLAHKGVNLLYLQIDEDIPAGIYSTFISEAASRGIDVHALSGDPSWVLPEQSGKLYHFIDWVNTYNNSVKPTERFNGIHLDVEPYVLPQWRSDPDTTIGLWRDLVSGFVQQVRADTHLTVGADLPVWLNKVSIQDGYGGKTTLSNWMIQKLDQVSLMAYLDNAIDIIKSVSNEMDEAEKAGTPVVIGVETFNNNEPHSSFYTKGNSQMQSELSAVVQAFSSKSVFTGYAVHEYESWSTLKE